MRQTKFGTAHYYNNLFHYNSLLLFIPHNKRSLIQMKRGIAAVVDVIGGGQSRWCWQEIGGSEEEEEEGKVKTERVEDG